MPRHPRTLLLALCLLVPGVCPGQYWTNFTTIGPAPFGLPITQASGFVTPPGCNDILVYPYPDNDLFIDQNLGGTCIFVAGTSPGGGGRACTERPITAPAATAHTTSVDLCAVFRGTFPASPDIGAFELYGPGGSTVLGLSMQWTNVATASAWSASVTHYDANGVQTSSPLPAGFGAISENTFTRWEVDYDLGSNRITAIRMTDFAGGGATFGPANWYLSGGAGATTNVDGYRLTADGFVAGATAAFDNVCVYPVGACPAPPPNTATPNWQINQPAARYSFVGNPNGGFCGPAVALVPSTAPTQLRFESTLSGTGVPWDLGVMRNFLLPVSGGAFVTAGGQRVHVDLADPTFVAVFGMFNGPAFVDQTWTVFIPTGPPVESQMAIVDPSTPSGLSFSQGIDARGL